MSTFLISVVIPVYNEEEVIGECLQSLMRQTYSNLEVIVVDDGSTDRTREIISRFKKVKLILGEHRGPGFSRNLGSKKAKGKILVFVDADMTFDKNYIEKLSEPILRGETFGTEERFQRASNLNKIWSRCWGSYSRGYPNKVKEGNVFRAILKKKFFEMGCFDPKYGYADDMTFYFKHGVKSQLVDGAVCYHKNPETLKEVYKQSRWIGASINNPFVRGEFVKYLVPWILIVLSPLAIILLSLKKCWQNKSFRLLFPWMLIFMGARYFGTINGLIRKIYLGKNVR